MQLSTLLSLAASLALTTALPKTRTDSVTVVFKGAGGAEYPTTIPTNGVEYNLGNSLSVSSIYSKDINVAQNCVLRTADHPPALVAISDTEWNVGPPQVIKTIKCGSGSSPSPPSQAGTAMIYFLSEGPNESIMYKIDLPLDGSLVPTKSTTKISYLYSTYVGIPKCTINFATQYVNLVQVGDKSWSVTPPQGVDSLSCT